MKHRAMSYSSMSSSCSQSNDDEVVHQDQDGNKVLKYEKFDPPTDKNSPEMEGPKPLDLDLMSDLQDVLFNNTSTAAPSSSGPPVNRHVSLILHKNYLLKVLYFPNI